MSASGGLWRIVGFDPVLGVLLISNGNPACNSVCNSAAVANSWIFIMMLPSPEKHTTLLPGSANAMPIAVGRPKPIVPNPPELIHCRGKRIG